MSLSAASYALGFGAGALSTLSPCVVPLLPIVVGSAMNAHRHGALALAAGLALSFTAIGVFVASLGFTLGLGGDVFRVAGGLIMGVFGAALLSSRLQDRFSSAVSGIESGAGGMLSRVGGEGLGGQFLVGILLGAVWSPCTGATLGSAALLASQQKDLLNVSITMLMFGLGAATPLLVVGTLSREVMQRWRGRLVRTGQGGKQAMGGLLILVSLLVISGIDKQVEAVFVAHAPDWLNNVSGIL